MSDWFSHIFQNAQAAARAQAADDATAAMNAWTQLQQGAPSPDNPNYQAYLKQMADAQNAMRAQKKPQCFIRDFAASGMVRALPYFRREYS